MERQDCRSKLILINKLITKIKLDLIYKKKNITKILVKCEIEK